MTGRGAAALCACTVLFAGTAQAAGLDSFYLGVRGGLSQSGTGSSRVQNELAAKGYTGVQAAASTHSYGTAPYLGYRLTPFASLELSYVYFGKYRVTAAAFANQDAFQRDLIRVQQPAGHGAALSLRLDQPRLFGPLDGAIRFGGYYWRESFGLTHSDHSQETIVRSGGGVTLGPLLSWPITPHFSIGATADVYLPIVTRPRPVLQEGLQIEYSFQGRAS
ncbi:MAG: hypothetical protein ACRETW_03890 [Stenotrophobium sp.]